VAQPHETATELCARVESGQVFGMGIVSWIILGLLAGAIAKILLPGRDPGGLVGTTLFGVAGAFVGGWLSAKVLHRPVQHHFFDAATWGAAIVGAFVLLVAYRILFGDSRERRDYRRR
jgi:uncharacterized membrane protein YeaQ/YmgE (transglycosylase-associated protein family)